MDTSGRARFSERGEELCPLRSTKQVLILQYTLVEREHLELILEINPRFDGSPSQSDPQSTETASRIRGKKSPPLLHRHHPLHPRMQRARIRKLPRLLKRMRIRILPTLILQRPTPPRPIIRAHRMIHIVLVRPHHRIPRLNRHFRRRKRPVLNRHRCAPSRRHPRRSDCAGHSHR
jgi:hypothetical protein